MLICFCANLYCVTCISEKCSVEYVVVAFRKKYDCMARFFQFSCSTLAFYLFSAMWFLYCICLLACVYVVSGSNTYNVNNLSYLMALLSDHMLIETLAYKQELAGSYYGRTKFSFVCVILRKFSSCSSVWCAHAHVISVTTHVVLVPTF